MTRPYVAKIGKEMADLEDLSSHVRADQERIKDRIKNLKQEYSSLLCNIDCLLLQTQGSWILK